MPSHSLSLSQSPDFESVLQILDDSPSKSPLFLALKSVSFLRRSQAQAMRSSILANLWATVLALQLHRLVSYLSSALLVVDAKLSKGCIGLPKEFKELKQVFRE